MTLKGKGMMIWKIPDCEGGRASAIAGVAAACGFSHVLIKIANETRPYNTDSQGNDLILPVADALRSKGIQVWGWHYIYGYNPVGEAAIAISQVKRLALDGYVIDAEAEFKLPGRDKVARTFMTELRKGLPTTPVALSTYRWPSYHPTFPYVAFLEKCDYNMPQVYWMSAHNPDYDLKRSVTEFKAINPYRPVIPTGPAFYEGNWAPTDKEVILFMDTAKSLGLTAANFFSWDYARTKLVPVWNAIANYNWPGELPPPVDDITDDIFECLNSGNAPALADLYAPNAVLVTPEFTFQGTDKIKTYYERLMINRLPQGNYTRTSRNSSGPTIHYTWTCTSYRARVNNGSDTLGLKDNKIVYHYSHFSVES
ncbi:MAG TPA: nuclear transport factor 2 family protein [Anaerolineaceae bacterium]|nr:nuclear transport factor 2 family protein [Anaerolineaceae bacterium]